MKTLVLCLGLTFCQLASASSEIIQSDKPMKNTLYKRYVNEAIKSKELRTRSYPTQIVRLSGNVFKEKMDCDSVLNTIEEVFTHKINHNLFSYMTLVSCSYDRDTGFAKEFGISSYFDPLSDAAINYLQNYIQEMQGQTLWGTPFEIESAKGLMISLNIAAGIKESLYDPTMLVLRSDRTNYYYSSNYELSRDMIRDIKDNFVSTDKEVVLPFLNRWIFSYADIIYERVLRSSNYVDLQPERMFLMEKEPKVFTPGLKMYYAHVCFDTENHHCL